MKKTTHALIAFLAFNLLAGCGLWPGKQTADYKHGATTVPALEVPPDLTRPETSQRYVIPAADGTQVAKYSEFSRNEKAVEQAPAESVSSSAAVTEVTSARLITMQGLRFVMLSEPFDRAWRKVSLALERARLDTSDVDRSKGVFYLKGAQQQVAELRVMVQERQGISVVTVVADAAAQSEAARILDLLFQRLEQ